MQSEYTDNTESKVFYRFQVVRFKDFNPYKTQGMFLKNLVSEKSFSFIYTAATTGRQKLI